MLFFGRETDHRVLYRNNPVLSTTVHAAVLHVTGCFTFGLYAVLASMLCYFQLLSSAA